MHSGRDRHALLCAPASSLPIAFTLLGTWLGEERDLYADYQAHIGGPAKSVVRIWLLGVTLFQRRQGACRYADIQISQPGTPLLKL
jgi:DUF3047 family protein